MMGLMMVSAGSMAQEPLEAPVGFEVEPVSVDEGTEPAPSGPVAYTLDPGQSLLAVTVYKDPNTLGAGLAHDHAIVASTFDGKVVWSADDASVCDVSISFPVTALTVDPGDVRTRVGIDPDDTVGEGGKKTIISNFSGKSQLNASVFPTISFQSRSCSSTTGKVEVLGDLSIRGVARAVTVMMDVAVDDQSFGAKGSFDLTHDDFGFKPFTAGFGALKNQDKLHFVVDVSGARN
jgi:polyisoprenoid-binding protein YceI